MIQGQIVSVETEGGHQIWLTATREAFEVWESRKGWSSSTCITARATLNDGLGHFAHWIQHAIDAEKPEVRPMIQVEESIQDAAPLGVDLMIPMTFAQVFNESKLTKRAFRYRYWAPELYAIGEQEPVGFRLLGEDYLQQTVDVGEAVSLWWTFESEEMYRARILADRANADLKALREKAHAASRAILAAAEKKEG